MRVASAEMSTESKQTKFYINLAAIPLQKPLSLYVANMSFFELYTAKVITQTSHSIFKVYITELLVIPVGNCKYLYFGTKTKIVEWLLSSSLWLRVAASLVNDLSEWSL